MKKNNIIIVLISAFFISSCGELFDDNNGADVYYDSFYEVGCYEDFSNVFIERFGTTSGSMEADRYIECETHTHIIVEFFDNPSSGQPNNYQYFLVNGKSLSYEDEITLGDRLRLSFTANPLYNNIPGTFYGIYRVTAINQDNGSYTHKDYTITAHGEPVY